jgi:hypothetical protein
MSEIELTESDLEVGAYVEYTAVGGILAEDKTHRGNISDLRTETVQHASEPDGERTVVVLSDGDDEHEVSAKTLIEEKTNESDNSGFRVDEFVPAEDEDEPEVVTDGGEDVTDHLTDAEIQDAIEQHDDTDHPDAHTVDDVRDVLARINADIIGHWDLHQDALDEGAYEIVHEDDDVIVMAEGGHFWGEQFDAMQLDDEGGILRSIIVNLQHVAARKHCDYSWSTSTPVVVRKTGDFRAGEQQVLREIARRTDEYGSVARAVDTLATETHGWSKGNWATLTGRNPSTVTRTTDN